MSIRSNFLVASAAALGFAGFLSAQQKAALTRSIAALTNPVGHGQADFSRQTFFPGKGRFEVRRSRSWLNEQRVRDLLTRGSAAYIDGLVKVRVIDDVVFVRGDSGAVRAVGDRLDLVEATLARPIDVEITVHQLPAGLMAQIPVPAVATAEQLKAFLAARDQLPLARVHAATIAGHAIGLNSVEHRRCVLDFDVEVAEEAQIGDPRVLTVVTGLLAVVKVWPTAGTDDMVVAVDGRFTADLGNDAPPVWTGSDYLGTIDMPVLFGLDAGFVTRVPDGGAACVVAHRRDLGGLVVTVECRHGSARSAPRNDEVAAMPFGQFGASEPRWATIEGAGGELADRLGGSGDELDGGFVVRDALDVRSALGQAFDGDLLPIGPWLVAIGPGASAHAANEAEQVVAMEHALLHEQSVRLEVREATGKHHTIVRLPGMTGRCSGVRFGCEKWAVDDYDVEIASKATAADPRGTGVFDGLIVSTKLVGGADPTVILLGAHCATGEHRRRPIEAEGIGDLYLMDSRVATLQHRGVAAVGTKLLLGRGVSVEVGGERAPTTVSAMIE